MSVHTDYHPLQNVQIWTMKPVKSKGSFHIKILPLYPITSDKQPKAITELKTHVLHLMPRAMWINRAMAKKTRKTVLAARDGR